MCFRRKMLVLLLVQLYLWGWNGGSRLDVCMEDVPEIFHERVLRPPQKKIGRTGGAVRRARPQRRRTNGGSLSEVLRSWQGDLLWLRVPRDSM